jgi:hypothetical protein
VVKDETLAWEFLITYDVHQHCALFHSTDTSCNCHKHQTYGYDYHESCRREEVIVHKDAEVIKNRWNGGSDCHQQKSSELGKKKLAIHVKIIEPINQSMRLMTFKTILSW